MLNSAQNTNICIWFDLCCSASGYVYCTRCSTCAPVSTCLSVERFLSRMRDPPPEVSAFSSAYVYQWLMTAPLHWQTRQQQKHQKDRQQQKRRRRNLKEKEETKGNMLYKWARAGSRVGADCIGEFEGGGGGGQRRVVMSEKKKATEKKKKEKPWERDCRARPGLEARLCLCLDLIDFQENCSRRLPSSLMKPSGICHPTTRPTPALHYSSLPPLSFSSLSYWDIRSQAHTLNHKQIYTCIHRHRHKLLVLHRQQTKDQ